MAKSAKYLLIGSTEAYSGKTATILGIAPHLKNLGLSLAYGKPLGTIATKDNSEIVEEDIKFIAETLQLSPEQIKSSLLDLDLETIGDRLVSETATDYSQALQEYVRDLTADLVILEGPGNLSEGSLFGLGVGQMAKIVDASILLVARYNSMLLVDSLLAAKESIGDRLLGVVINDIPQRDLKSVTDKVKPYLDRQGINVLAMLTRTNLLRGISVREITKQLDAKVLCREDRLDLMVESLSIGAMNVTSALKYFRQRKNMAVVTGSDRADLQMAALETSTHCLILTGFKDPDPLILSRAEDLEVPVLSVNRDTLTTVEIVDRSFGRVRVQEPIKVDCIQNLMKQYFEFDRFLNLLAIDTPVSAQ